MSPIVLLVFAPAIFLGIAFASLLLGAAAAGVWETFEQRPQANPVAAAPGPVEADRRQAPRARAA
jgi:hypothetical protein